MKMKLILFPLLCLFLASSVMASTYLKPKAGYFVPVDGGDGSYTLGLALGYDLIPMFAIELGYSRIIGTGNASDGDHLSGEGIFHFPLPIATPYASGGIGLLH